MSTVSIVALYSLDLKIHWLQNEDQEELKPTITPGDYLDDPP